MRRTLPLIVVLLAVIGFGQVPNSSPVPDYANLPDTADDAAKIIHPTLKHLATQTRRDARGQFLYTLEYYISVDDAEHRNGKVEFIGLVWRDKTRLMLTAFVIDCQRNLFRYKQTMIYSNKKLKFVESDRFDPIPKGAVIRQASVKLCGVVA